MEADRHEKQNAAASLDIPVMDEELDELIGGGPYVMHLVDDGETTVPDGVPVSRDSAPVSAQGRVAMAREMLHRALMEMEAIDREEEVRGMFGLAKALEHANIAYGYLVPRR